jgi:uncharacterized protein YccT (UPF0319 family)
VIASQEIAGRSFFLSVLYGNLCRAGYFASINISVIRGLIDVKRLFLTIVVLTVAQLSLAGCAIPKKTVHAYHGPLISDANIAKLLVPATIVVEAIDDRDKAFDLSSFSGTDTEYHLLPGEHILTVRFVKILDIGGGEIDKVRSNRTLVTISVDAGKYYQLTHPELPYSENVKSFARNPEFWLEEESGTKQVVREVNALAFQRRGSLLDNITPSVPVARKDSASSEELSSLDLMKFWWSKATAVERATFLTWINSRK